MKLFSKVKKFIVGLINKIDTPLWLEILFALIILLRIPSLFEPFYYGDEMIYLTLGEGIRKGIPLYLGLHDNKPPFLYLIAAISGNVFWFKVLLGIFNLVAIYLFWKLTTLLATTRKNLQKVSTIIFAVLSTLPLFEGNIANAENFMVVPTLFAFIYLFSKNNSLKKFFLSGFMLSLATLFKIVASVDILVIVAFLIISAKKIELAKLIKRLALLGLGFVTPLGISFVYYFFRGALNEYITAAFLQNVSYVSSWRPSDSTKPFLEKNLPLIIRGLIMLVGYVVLFITRKKISRPFVFSVLWLLSSLFAATLSERPYPHYLLQEVPSLSILLAILFTYKNSEQVFAVIPLTLAFFVPFYFKFWYYPTFTYYQRFIKFATNNISKEDYFLTFSENLPRNYKIAQFLSDSSKKSDGVFVWSNDSAGIYALSRRIPPTKYVADYHFVDFASKDEVLKTLNSQKPKFIIITPNSFEFKELANYVKINYFFLKEIDSAKIWINLKDE